jgi:hypothetical protein
MAARVSRSPLIAPIAPLAAACLVAILGVACAEQGGASSASAVADAYLAGLAAHDPAAIRRVVPPDFDAEQAIAEKLAKYEGVNVGSLRRDYVPNDITPNHVKVVITADTPAFEDVVHVMRQGRRWYVSLGRLRGFTPGPTAQIRPASP